MPALYEQSYLHYTRQGARVLALGYKEVASQPVSKLKGLKREDAESNLMFAGLVVFGCPNKYESAMSIKARTGLSLSLSCTYIYMYVYMYLHTYICIYIYRYESATSIKALKDSLSLSLSLSLYIYIYI